MPPGRVGSKKPTQFEVRQREVEAVKLRAQHRTYDEIAQIMGWSDESTARKAVQRALQRNEEENVEELRRVENAKIDLAEQEAWRILRTRWTKVDHGRVMYEISEEIGEDGLPKPTVIPMENPDPHAAALRILTKLMERRAALRGLDAPTRRIVEVITDDDVRAATEALRAQLAELDGLDLSNIL